MRNFTVYLLLGVFVLCLAVVAVAGVKNTPHDIAWWKDPNNAPAERQVCVNCHSPHATGTVQPQLIWNRNRVFNGTLTFYNSATFDMGPANNTYLAPQTMLCLTCHDGQASTLVNYPGSGNTANNLYDLADNEIAVTARIANNGLADDHPVAFVYDKAKDSTNNFPDITNGKINGVYPVFTIGGTDNTFQCATCHDVHNNGDVPGDGIMFTRGNMQGSQMCGDCHTTKL